MCFITSSFACCSICVVHMFVDMLVQMLALCRIA